MGNNQSNHFPHIPGKITWYGTRLSTVNHRPFLSDFFLRGGAVCTQATSRLLSSEEKTSEHDNTTNFPRKKGLQCIKFKMWSELSNNLDTLVTFLLRTNSLYQKPTVGFSPHTYGRVRLARFTREDHAYGTSRLPKMEENDCFAV